MQFADAIGRLLAARTLDETEAAFRRLAPHRAALGAQGGVGPRIYDLGIDMKDAKRVDLAEECFRFALSVTPAAGDPAILGAANNHLGVLALEQGRSRAARHRFEVAIRVREAAAPRVTDDAWVYLAGTFVNLGNTKLDAWDAGGAAESYASAIARLHAARDAGSRAGALAPFLANAERGAAAAAKLAGLARPRIGVSSIAAPPGTDGMTSASVRAYVGRPAAAFADASAQGELEALRLRAMAKGGFLAAGPERAPWDWDEHDEAIDCFDAAIELAPDDLELRRFKARALFRAASVGQASTRAFLAARDKYAPDVFEQLLAVPRCRYTGGAARTSDAYAQALRLAPDDAPLHAERDENLRELA